MNSPSSVSALTSTLVHHSAMSPAALRQRHATFIAKRLAVSFSALAIAPFFLAYRGAPTGTETLVFACSFAPLASAVLLARTGRLATAHGVAFLGLVALSLSLWLGLGCGATCAIAWLITAQLEAMLAGQRWLSLAAGILTGTILLAIFATMLDGALLPHAMVANTEAFAGLALAYAIVVAAGSWSVAGPLRRPAPDRAKTDDHQTWQLVAGMLDELIIALDRSGSVVGGLDRRESWLEMPVSSLSQRGLFDRVHVADRPMFLQQIAAAAHGEATAPAKLRLRTTDSAFAGPPRHMWIELRTKSTVARLDSARRTEADVIAVLRDIDAAQAQDEEIATARRAIEEATGSKDHFLANMSHELRTPLNAIIGFSEMLASRTLCPADADKQREYARIILQSGQHLLSVVNAILDMSKIRSGSLTLVPEPFDIIPLIDLCCDMVALKAEDGRVRIVRDHPKRLEGVVGDKRACKQILINLLSNAIKFTPENGQIKISAGHEGSDLVIGVSDTGVGIDAGDLARVGAPFFQAQVSASRPFEGTGLGLSVVRGLVGLHGGTISIESELGQGTRVTVRLPRDGQSGNRNVSSAPIETFVRSPPIARGSGRNDQGIRKIA